jgi:hypothetical protein
MQKLVLCIYPMKPRVFGLVDYLPGSGPLESVADLGLGVMFREALNTCILQVWYPSIVIHCTLFHVDFENGLTISVLQNTATRHKNLPGEIEKSF